MLAADVQQGDKESTAGSKEQHHHLQHVGET
jgi:hypothetical protein